VICRNQRYDGVKDPCRLTSGPNRGFQFHKCRQLFIRLHNKTLSIAAMRVNNPDRSALRIDD